MHAESGTIHLGTLIMSKQELKALSAKAVDRGVAAREVAGVQLTSEQTERVSGGYLKDHGPTTALSCCNGQHINEVSLG